MTISTIRRYEEDDKARVKIAAEAFCSRHGISYDAEYDGQLAAENAIEHAIYTAHPEDLARLRKLWTACYCRALRVPCDVRITTGYGYIGVRV